MPDRFDIERRAAELFPSCHEGYLTDRNAAIQLARELAEAIAVKLDSLGCHGQTCAEIARSFARPRSREDVYRAAVERIAKLDRALTYVPEAINIAQRALDKAEKARP